MTKTLTEQWRDGTLPDAEYYVKNKSNVVVVDYYCELTKSFAAVFPCNVKEVLAPVPSYDEWKQAKENLDKNGTWYTERSHKELLKQIELLQEQKQKVIALIKDGRFVEALQELENER